MEYDDCYGTWNCQTSSAAAVTKVNEEPSSPPRKSLVWKPMSPVEARSPCACGCIYIVHGQRQVDITSGESCPTLPITWTIKVNSIIWRSIICIIVFLFQPSGKQKSANVTLLGVSFSCANSILNIRRRQEPDGIEEMIYQTESDMSNSTSLMTSALGEEALTFEFHAPRRSCRVNIKSRASASGQLFTMLVCM